MKDELCLALSFLPLEELKKKAQSSVHFSVTSMTMSDHENPSPEPSDAVQPPTVLSDSSPRPPSFDPSRTIGIIKRKALIKELAAAYHAECLAACQELLELQKKWDEPYIELKPPDEPRKEPPRPSKRLKKSR